MKDKVKGIAIKGGSAIWEVVKKQLFTYPTKQKTRLHDWRLGILFNLLTLGVFLYILIHPILLQRRFVLLETPVGAIEFTVVSPQRAKLYNESWAQQYVIANSTDIPFCSGYINRNQTAKTPYTLPCVYWTEELVLYPSLEQSALFLTTRVNTSTKTLRLNRNLPTNFTYNTPLGPDCSLETPNCYYTTITNPASSNYVAIVDDFTIEIIHSFECSGFGIARNADTLPGIYKDTNGKRVYATNPGEYIGNADFNDKLRLSTILRASGVNLEDTTISNDGTSVRYNGIVLLMVFTYTNMDTVSDRNDFRYSYTSTSVSGAEFKAVEDIYTKNYSTIAENNRHGVRIIVIQTGNIGQFDFQTLLLTLISGMGLLAVAVAVSDILGGLCWGERMVSDAYPTEDEDEDGGKVEETETTVGQVVKFLKWPFMRLRDKEGNEGDIILPPYWPLHHAAGKQAVE
eukprot:TRINITY_DN2857_c0_g1_i1.p1 TRINITY_DN2857_c0_g1~~TRINITY_DN2857_c0_g1_i1.p1  ORF type:complete len:457 (-),score=78.63 TRINITY_DN2857_c0_g1_i1:65-1435(-)